MKKSIATMSNLNGVNVLKTKMSPLALACHTLPMLYLNSANAANNIAGPGCDFIGDRADDHAFAAAYEDIGSIVDAGAVSVI